MAEIWHFLSPLLQKYWQYHYEIVGRICGENSPMTGEFPFPAHRASNAENVSIWWRHHVSVVMVIVPRSMKEYGCWCQEYFLNCIWMLIVTRTIYIWYYQFTRVPSFVSYVSNWHKEQKGINMQETCFLNSSWTWWWQFNFNGIQLKYVSATYF